MINCLIFEFWLKKATRNFSRQESNRLTFNILLVKKNILVVIYASSTSVQNHYFFIIASYKGIFFQP